jgi:hypothetical protein
MYAQFIFSGAYIDHKVGLNMAKFRRTRTVYVKPRRRRSSFRARFRRRGRKDKSISILTSLPAIQRALVEPIFGGNEYGAVGALKVAQAGDIAGAAREFSNIAMINFTGYDMRTGTWNSGAPTKTYSMLIAGYVGHMIANKIGANRAMGKIPLIGKYVKL